MRTTAAIRHAELLRTLRHGREQKTLTEEEEDRILDEMDFCWWEMTDEEQQEANASVADRLTSGGE